MTTADPTIDLAALMREHQAGVWRYLRALGCETNLADDLTQETFLAVFKSPFEQRSRGQTVAYLRIVAKNLFLKSRRKDGRQMVMAEMEHLESQWSELAGEEDGAELANVLRECLKQIDEKPRQALDLQYKQGKQRVEIAKTMGMTDDGIKTLLRRTKARLRKCMELRVKG